MPARVQHEGRVYHVEIPEDCRFFTVAQVTAMIACSRVFLYRICNNGSGPPMIKFKNGKRTVIRFPILAFREWMSNATEKPKCSP